MFRYTINPDSDTPIYRQLVDQINARIRSGAIPTGTQMPTVREMADRLHLSCGTVKRVYDCLQEMGDIEMTRRRGTFVKYVREDGDSRKIRAMTAIDRMIRQLSELNFSPAEIQIFLNLKMREWGLKWSGLRIAMITQYMELAPALEKQMGQVANARVYIYPLRQLREYPYSVDEQCDVILASPADGQRISPILPDASKLICMALCADAASIRSLSLLPEGKIGVLCEDEAFAELVRSHAPDGDRKRILPCLTDADLNEFDALILAGGYESGCSEAVRGRIDAFRREKPVLDFNYRMDEGSMLHLEERIKRIRYERQLQPGALHF